MEAAKRVGDTFIAGYITSVLERELNWETDRYVLRFVNGVTTLTMFKDGLQRQEEAG